MKSLNPVFGIVLILLFSSLIFSSCEKDTTGPTGPGDPDLPYSLGWNAAQEDADSIPADISFGFGNQNLPSAYDLTDRFPRVGDQGQYGTCVAFAVGFHGKTAINAIDHNLFTADLNNPSRQTSALDLFLSIPDRGANCEGAYFESAMKVLAERGVANSEVAPYVNVGDCSQSPDPSWTTSASDNKIANFRKVENEVTALKRYVADNRPVVFGARLGDNFMNWNSEEVLTGHTSFSQVGIHAHHAMVIVGFDDNKGPRGAFRVINSWGDFWGDAGFIWVDYQFMINPEFGTLFFVMQNDASDLDPNDNPPSVSEIDVLPWGLYDDYHIDGTTPRDRALIFDLYNIGSGTVQASSNWDMIYCFVNPYDAEDWGVILHGHITNQFGGAGEIGEYPAGHGISNFWMNTNIPTYSSLGYELFGSDIQWNYTMPNLNGYYYLVMAVDPERQLDELNRMNNYYWIGNQYGQPIYFNNGEPFGIAGEEESLQLISKNSSPVNMEKFKMEPRLMNPSKNWNAYTNGEMDRMMQYQFANNLVKRIAPLDDRAELKSSGRAITR